MAQSVHSEGWYEDTARLAAEAELSLANVERAVEFQEAFARFADGVVRRYPRQISAIWTDPVPARRGYVRFTGRVPRDVLRSLSTARNGLRSHNVSITGQGVIPFAAHARRAQVAIEALAAQGYENAIAAYDPATNRIKLELQVNAPADAPTEADVVWAVQNHVLENRNGGVALEGRAARFFASDVDLEVVVGTEPMLEFDHSRGGNILRDDGFFECTSGWSVSGPNGDGIITAGHCTGLNQFEQPGLTPYSMVWRSQVFGAGGDAEYHTTSHIELPEFYATATSIRDVTGEQFILFMPGSSVCVYGRSSNNRTCNHTVEAIFVTVLISGTSVGNMVRASNDTVIGGDSGGGWSFGNTAWGVHSASSAGTSPANDAFFTPIYAARSALGVSLMTR